MKCLQTSTLNDDEHEHYWLTAANYIIFSFARLVCFVVKQTNKLRKSNSSSSRGDETKLSGGREGGRHPPPPVLKI